MIKSKKLLSLILVAVLLIGSAIPVFADAQPMYLNGETGEEYNTVQEVIAAIREGELIPEEVYVYDVEKEGYVNALDRYNAKMNAYSEFIKENNISDADELLANEELLAGFVNAGKEAEESVPAKSKDEIVEEPKEELKVVEISAINANTISVTFEGMEPVKITLETPLVHGQTEVTFVYEGVEYTATLSEAYTDPAVVDAEAAKAVEDAIAALPAVDELTLEDAEAVAAARADYEALTEAQKALVTNLAVLEAAEVRIAELEAEAAEQAKAEAIENAINTINLIGNPATLTLEDEAKVVAARAAVDAALELGAVETDIVNYDHLLAAETQINALKEALNEKETAIQEANVALTNLPLEVTLEDKAQVKKARELVNKALELGAEENDFVNLWKLEAAEAKIAKLEEEAAEAEAVQAVIDAINALPEEITLEDAEAVADARAAYDALTEEQQKLVTNLDVLEAAEAKIAELEEEAAKELKVESVRAINDLKTKKATVTGTVTKGEEVEDALKVEIVINKVTDKDPVEVAKVDVELKEDGTFENIIDTSSYKAAKYVVVVKATAGELEAEATAEFEIDKAELEAIDAVVDAVKNARNQIELEEALKAEEFENVDFDKIADYEKALKANSVVLNTVADIQKVIDSVNKRHNEKALLDNIIKARDAGVDKDLLAALRAADLKVEDEDGNEVAVEIKVDAVKDYYVALASINEGSSLVDVAKAIKTENERPLNEVNKATSAENMKTALKNNADRLGLDLTAFNELEPEGRQTAALNDLIDNRELQEDKKYTEETLKTIFNEIVETRTVIQEAMRIYEEASTDNPLKDMGFITMVKENLEGVSYKKISGQEIDKVLEETGKVEERFNALEGEKVRLDDETDAIDAQKAVFKKMSYNGTASFTQAVTDFYNALTAVEEKVEALSKVTSVEAKIETELPDNNNTVTVKAGTVVTVKLTAKNNGDTQEKFNKVIPRIDVKHGEDNYIVLRNVVFEKGVATVDVKLEKVGNGVLDFSSGFGDIIENEEGKDVKTTKSVTVEAGDLTVIEGKVTEAGVVLTGQDDYKNAIDLAKANVVDATIDGKDILLANINENNETPKILTISDLELEAETEYTITLVYKVGEETKTFEITFKTPKAEAGL